MFTKRMNEIKERKAAILTELESADEQRTKELGEETDGLIREETSLRAKMDVPGRMKEKEPEADRSEHEKRGADLREKRAVTIGGGTLIKPMDNQQYINDMMGVGASIVDQVKVTNCYGMSEYQVPYVVSKSSADKTAEGTDATESAPAFAYASIKPVTIATYAEVSREVTKLTNVAYYEAVQQAARKSLRAKVSEYIVTSDAATSQTFFGILAAPAITAATDITIAAIDDKTLRKITMSYGGDEDIVGGGILYLTKKDLIAFGDVRGTNEKKAVYEITPDGSNTNTGIITDGGLSVRYSINKSLTALADATAGKYVMFYGVPSCYELGLFSDYTVRVSEDYKFKSRMLAVMGEVMIGGNVVVKDGFVRVKK